MNNQEMLLTEIVTILMNDQPAYEQGQQILAKAEKHYAKLMEQEYERGRDDERERMRVWGNERCLEHHTSMNNVIRRCCNECWQALKSGE